MHFLVSFCCCLDELLCGMKLVVVGPIPKQTAELKKKIIFFSEKIVIIGLTEENILMPILFPQLEMETDANFSKVDPSSDMGSWERRVNLPIIWSDTKKVWISNLCLH